MRVRVLYEGRSRPDMVQASKTPVGKIDHAKAKGLFSPVLTCPHRRQT